MLSYNQITKLIAELLFHHDCVIVPNFGGFVGRSYNSNFNKGNNILYPQTKQILFNKNLLHNDGLLISALMEKNSITAVEATKYIEDYKDYIQSLLSVKKRFELTNIGLLYFDNENVLRFEAKSDVNFLLDSFGFEPVLAKELFIEIEKPKATPRFEDRTLKISEQPVKVSKKSYAKIAALAVGIPISMAFLLLSAYSEPMKPILQSSFNPFYTPEVTYSPKHNALQNSLIIEPVEKQTLLMDANGFANFKLSENGTVLVASLNDSISIADKTSVVKSKINLSKLNNSFDGKYQVVMGCFGVEENANNLIKDLKSKNIIAGISGLNNKGLHVVSCGGFNSKDEASALLSSIKSNFPNAWVMKK
jgi:hypothetical protein